MKKRKVERPVNPVVRMKASRTSGRPRKTPTTFPEDRNSAESLQTAIHGLMDAQSEEVVSYAEQAADLVKRATIQDISTGALPSPDDNALEVEHSLYYRAMVQARRSPFLTGGYTLDGLLTFALIYQSSDRVGWSGFNTFAALAENLRLNSSPVAVASTWNDDSTAARLTMLYPEMPDWSEVAAIALRDVILTELAKDPEAVRKIGIRQCTDPTQQTAPIWVCPSPADATPRREPSRRKSANGTRSRAKA